MKYLKLISEMYIDEDNADQYENIIKQNYRFFPGEHIRVPIAPDLNPIFKIKKINTIDNRQPYEIQSIENAVRYWYSGDNAELVPDYELDAMKYNL